MNRKILLLSSLALMPVFPQNAPPPRTLPDGYVARAPITARGLAPGVRFKELGSKGRTLLVNFSRGDEVASGLTEFAEKHHLTTSHITGIGAFDSAVFGWFDPEKGAYKKIVINQEAEVVSFIGSVTMQNGKPYFHAHVSVALPDGSVKGGHLIEAHVSLFMEVFVIESAEP